MARSRSDADRSELILIVAPVGRDSELLCSQLAAHGLEGRECSDMLELAELLPQGAGAIFATEEALTPNGLGDLNRALAKQPPWSQIPIVIFTGTMTAGPKPLPPEIMKRTNVTLVDRPVRIQSLISAAHSALRARERQYEIRDLMRELEERVQERDRFLAVLGHELRNPLGAILLAAQMRDDDGKLDGDHADLIERQSRHLTRLVNDLLDLSRVAAGKIVLKQQPVDLRDVAAEALRVLQPVGDAQRVAIQLQRCARPLIVRGDPVRLDQIVTNVLSNAIKYTPEEGHVRVVLAEEEGSAVIRVTDDGVGIAPERIGVIFELFAQAENAIGRAQGGMGIGLALVRNLMELHDGTVEARSEGIGKGSEFLLRLPLATIDEQHAFQTPPRAEAPPAQLPPRKIAIVEDNADVRDLLRLKLKRLGHEVVIARDGVEGVQIVIDEKPDLALVDLGLPGIDGYAVAREVREKLGENVVLVAVSGFGQPEDKRRALASGFDEHITKPADVKDIEGVLRRFPPRNSSPDANV
ncbi:MAG TPA: hybrid sensor histidine kinase/response regulator [Thermoanaerobaculia bacterium]|nr:hybrid sensor histidine kinase/response regulator [Thermoanaerobaculia bacterium]